MKISKNKLSWWGFEPGTKMLGCQFACAPMYYGVFSAIADVTNDGCGCCFGDEKGSRKGST